MIPRPLNKNFLHYTLALLFLGHNQASLAQDNQANTNSTAPVISGGLGIEFTMSESDLLAKGFSPSPRIEDKGEFSKIEPEASFPIHRVTVTPISSKIASISGSRYYKKSKLQDPYDTCLIDKRLLIDTIKDKYPSLVKINIGLPPSDIRTEDTYCEAKSSRIVFGRSQERGEQRCITISCMRIDDKALVEISYSDKPAMNAYYPEREAYLKSIQNQRLKERNFDANEL